ncbi:hypothetical protein [Helicobacter sp. 11S02596-1]|uniref:hypothetical protein n=1 Tax=Helicobacter sp. 11S02596-1 TaxID=1476194 RepID=UPI000BA6FE72|nr:hypothetical protein [Helicobacter sp. 11S02596-1]PAF42822.1 hypothetical protein BJI48_06100 [Helicobacter sp. 11S02596-1]
MKKLTFITLLACTFNLVEAIPPVEGDVLDSNSFVLGVDTGFTAISTKNAGNIPYQYGVFNLNGQYAPLPTYQKADTTRNDRILVPININLRYGLFNYLEVFGNANASYQSFNPKTSTKSDVVGFNNANVGLMITLYKGDTFRLIIGDDSDIISNAVFANGKSNYGLFKGHTFFLNIIRRKEEGAKFGSFTAQLFYRLNLKQSYNSDMSFKNGDEWGFKYLWQLGKENKLGFFEGIVSWKQADRINGEKINYDGREAFGIGFGTGSKFDFNQHVGGKISFEFMSYTLERNALSAGITFGIYFK